VALADWIVDGGQIIFAGTPTEFVSARSTLTGEDLAAYIGD
jgi:excinuclease UvrABC ATPase subunit